MGVQSIVKDLIQSRSHAENEVAYIPLTDTSVLPAEASHISDGRVEFQLGVDSSTDEDDDGDTLANGELELDDLEREKLRRVSDAIPIAAFTIVLVEFCERFAFYGLSGVFQNYLQNPLPPGGNGAGAPASPSDPYPAGALGLGQGSATTLNNSFGFLAYALSIVGAVIADAYWGRYKTISSCCFVYVIGLVVITFTSFPSLLAGGFGLMGWIVGVIIVAIGTGGIKGVCPRIFVSYMGESLIIHSQCFSPCCRPISQDDVVSSHTPLWRTRSRRPDNHYHTHLQPVLLVYQCGSSRCACYYPA